MFLLLRQHGSNKTVEHGVPRIVSALSTVYFRRFWVEGGRGRRGRCAGAARRERDWQPLRWCLFGRRAGRSGPLLALAPAKPQRVRDFRMGQGTEERQLFPYHSIRYLRYIRAESSS